MDDLRAYGLQCTNAQATNLTKFASARSLRQGSKAKRCTVAVCARVTLHVRSLSATQPCGSVSSEISAVLWHSLVLPSAEKRSVRGVMPMRYLLANTGTVSSEISVGSSAIRPSNRPPCDDELSSGRNALVRAVYSTHWLCLADRPTDRFRGNPAHSREQSTQCRRGTPPSEWSTVPTECAHCASASPARWQWSRCAPRKRSSDHAVSAGYPSAAPSNLVTSACTAEPRASY